MAALLGPGSLVDMRLAALELAHSWLVMSFASNVAPLRIPGQAQDYNEGHIRVMEVGHGQAQRAIPGG